MLLLFDDNDSSYEGVIYTAQVSYVYSIIDNSEEY